uniref:Glycine zipper n=1 Tax=Candidatus Kentrum sp. LPFa TaxID=2126335 RepID=A0A450Y2A0_9GAMM|nr:MAG: hypothetical protein BECKLPF1236A_GA0070988_103983 [Candidatus Kentron sp. LPFa]VFK35645.1 MAG: hypothetical protein BECKLPF1236C_GA0070990_104023 [Candidatus Kentron sp. LPFa]
MQYKCIRCGTINNVPKGKDPQRYTCHSCGTQLPSTPESDGELSTAVGFIGGAALGASIGGPVGAIIGGIFGGIIGNQAKGVG